MDKDHGREQLTDDEDRRDPNGPSDADDREGPAHHGGGRSNPLQEGSPHSPWPLGLLAEIVAGVNVGVQVKLLTGYFAVALLVLGIAALTLLVISSMNHQVSELTRLQKQVESAIRKNNLVTAQLHFMALGLLTGDEAQYVKTAEAKREFSEELALAEVQSGDEKSEFFRRLRDANDRFSAAGSEGVGPVG